MNRSWLLVLLSIVSACSREATTAPSFQTVDVLVANPELLKSLRAQCKADHARVGDAQCGAVSEATRRVFMGNGTQYKPHPFVPTRASAASASSQRAS